MMELFMESIKKEWQFKRNSQISILQYVRAHTHTHHMLFQIPPSTESVLEKCWFFPDILIIISIKIVHEVHTKSSKHDTNAC